MSPVAFRWDGEAMRPLHPKAGERFVAERLYWLEEVSERSWVSHAQQFAWLAEAWRNLPEAVAGDFPTPEHLRKAALIACGWYDQTSIEAATPEEAAKLAAYAGDQDEFAVVGVHETMVVIRKAKSQAMRGPNRMSKADFQASKTAIMEFIASIIGVAPDELGRARAA